MIKDRLTGLEPNQRLTDSQRADVLAIVADYEKRLGYVDILTIGRSVLFSGKWVTSLEELRKHTMYNRVRPGGYECAGYLDGLEVVHMDYRELFERERGNSRALFVLDPPYLTTECGMYENYWKLTDYLNVLRLLKARNTFISQATSRRLSSFANGSPTSTGKRRPCGARKCASAQTR